eukprot:CAMPEP_0113906888 /NCGR_PEP_ID=MMETSP0780_2-20120614/25088_1 /TAXON_ID=652834 /ORGANISM="Palpitomonas bilix" /LENGTH=368 /DNA_ID=CAMNT_0000901719 /DNA_START=198 /DNA_END=1301 /DNA_ORIENTATION=+ /assembly_acc=CAM_ASM_000599
MNSGRSDKPHRLVLFCQHGLEGSYTSFFKYSSVLQDVARAFTNASRTSDAPILQTEVYSARANERYLSYENTKDCARRLLKELLLVFFSLCSESEAFASTQVALLGHSNGGRLVLHCVSELLQQWKTFLQTCKQKHRVSIVCAIVLNSPIRGVGEERPFHVCHPSCKEKSFTVFHNHWTLSTPFYEQTPSPEWKEEEKEEETDKQREQGKQKRKTSPLFLQDAGTKHTQMKSTREGETSCTSDLSSSMSQLDKPNPKSQTSSTTVIRLSRPHSWKHNLRSFVGRLKSFFRFTLSGWMGNVGEELQSSSVSNWDLAHALAHSEIPVVAIGFEGEEDLLIPGSTGVFGLRVCCGEGNVPFTDGIPTWVPW